MARGRKALATAIDTPPINDAAIAGDLVAHDQLATLATQQEARVRAVAQQLGYQLPAECTDPDLIQRDIAANMRRSVEACLEVGRGLTVLKEACGHGNFLARLEVLGVEHSVAKRFMQAAVKFSNGASTHLLKAAGNQTKLFELLVLDDEQIEDLELTGQSGELKLDEIATMSVKELRAALREARADGEAREKILAAKDAKMNDLAAQLERRPTAPSWPEQFADLNDEIAGVGSAHDELMGKFLVFVDAAEALMDQLPPDQIGAGRSCVHRLSESIDRMCHLAAALRDQFETRLSGYIAEDMSHILPAEVE
ncbi:MAG TPA: hypothetical protein VJ576_02660 [Rhodocyclaceae bacterium]|nr:hypothetical protein [Rhodocyclaceae bacterium]